MMDVTSAPLAKVANWNACGELYPWTIPAGSPSERVIAVPVGDGARGPVFTGNMSI